jgi:hypothetical protein
MENEDRRSGAPWGVGARLGRTRRHRHKQGSPYAKAPRPRAA